MKTLQRAFALCAITAFTGLTQTQPGINVSGTWQIEYHDKDGVEIDTPMISFFQSGGHLDGVFGDKHWKVDGAVNGDHIEFFFHPPVRPDITVRYQGRVESGARMSGTMASEVQSGTFTATRK